MTATRTPARSTNATSRPARRPAGRSAELLRPTPVALAVSMALGLLPTGASAQSNANLPVGCVATPTACGGRAFDPSGALKAPTLTTPNLLTVNQGNAASAIYNWQSFNIGQGNTVQFLQSGPSAVALNRIFDNSTSTIDGALKANGQLYLLNPNGIVFGANARIDVGGLIAATLNTADSRVTRGLLTEAPDKAVFFSDPDFAATAGVEGAGKIRVLPGAQLYAAGRDATGTVVSAGRVFLFAPDVANAGEIKVDGGGQVILAAGNKVFLGSTSDATLRGLLVETNDGVKVENSGKITTARGNITLMGLAVKQSGELTATSAIRENGSIRLVARETSAAPQAFSTAVSTDTLLPAARTGVVDVASGSSTRVLLDSTDTGTAALNDANAKAARSRIGIEGGTVNIGVDAGTAARVEARGGDITIAARADVGSASYAIGSTANNAALLGREDASAVVNVGANAVIDASGLTGVSVDGARNFVFIERLTSNDMANTPLQRDGWLRGQGVYMNVALDHAFIDNSGRRDAVAGTQAERNAVGGNVALRAEGAVNVAQGAVIDVSGGSTATTAGIGRASQLVTSTGKVVDITNASATEVYVGFADKVVVNVSSPDEGIDTSTTYNAPKSSAVGGFSSGMAAGSVEITAPRGVLEGTLLARTSVQPQQGSAPPAGGELRIGSAANGQTLDQQAYLQRASVILGTDAAALRGGLTDAQQARSIVLDTGELRSSGFTKFNLVSDGRIELASRSALDLGVGGQFSAQGNQVTVNSNITAAGGSITLAERPVTETLDGSPSAARRDELAGELQFSAQRGSVVLASGAQLSTAGRWTNESRLPPAQAGQQALALNGGKINLSGHRVDVSQARLDVSAGAQATAGGRIVGGKGGDLTLSATPSLGVVGTPALALGDGLADRIAGYGVTGSGTLTITAPEALVLAATAPGSGDATWLDAGRIGTRGFANYTFGALNTATLAAGTTFRPETHLLQPTAALTGAPSATGLLDVLQPQLALPLQQKPAQVTLRTTNLLAGVTTVEAGAVLDAGIGGKVTVTGGQRAQVDGSLVARAGNVAVGLADRGTQSLPADVFAGRVTELGASGRIDVSGASRVIEALDGRRSGDVLDAGRVDMTASAGTLNIAGGAQISARGAVDQVTPRGATAATQTVASAGGAVTLTGDQGLFVGQNGSGSVVDAHGGDASANGGRLSVRLKLADTLENATDASVTAALKLPRELHIDISPAAVPAAGAPFDAATYGGKGQVTTALINDSGFDQVWLASSNAITFGQDGGTAPARVELASRGLLSLEARQIVGLGATTLALDAPYVSIGSGRASLAGTAATPGPRGDAATSGQASLAVKARDIDIVGTLALQGIGDATLSARADVRGIYATLADDGSASARLSVGNTLRIEAAQVAPATLTNFTLESTAPIDAVGEGRIVVTRPAADSGTPLAPLSAGGVLTVKANDIEIDGRLTAPFGAIDLQGARSVLATSDAELSVAGQGVVPFGSVASGARWTYNSGDGKTLDVASAAALNLPDKSVRIVAPTVDLQAGSRVDVSGGGRLQATEFVAGPGGSFDVTKNFPQTLNGVALRNTLFALLPSRGTAVAAFDPQIVVGDTTGSLTLNGALADSSVFRIGQTLTVAAGSGIPAGTYTVLPAGYAVLPGAYAVQPVAGTTDFLPGTAVAEAAGTVVVAGKLGFSEAGTQASRWSGYRVYDGAQFRKLAELKAYDGDTFAAPFAAALGVSQRLARDAGSLAIGADSLRIASDFATAAASGGRGVDASISAPHIVVGSAPVATSAAPSDTLTIAASQLDGWNAETLVLGALATRSAASDATVDLTRTGQTVVLQGAAAVRGGEVILAASDSVATGIGSAVQSTAAAPATRQLNASGDGALLWVSASNSDALTFTRNGATQPADDTTKGTLTLGIGTTLAGTNGTARRAGNVVFDGTREQTFGSGLDVRADAVSLSGSTVNLGEVPQGTAGLNVDAALLASLASASRVTLTSASGFTSFGTATVGATGAGGQPTLDLLRLRGQGIQGAGGDGDTLVLTARNVVLDNRASPSDKPLPAAGTGTGALQIRALRDATAPQATGNILVAGSFANSGFASTELQTGTDLRFTGAVGAASTFDAGSAALNVDAARITADRGVHAALATTGNVKVTASGSAPATRTQEAGATLALSGAAVDFGGRISLPAGVVAISATGFADTDHVTLRSGSVIDAAGQTQHFGPAGSAVAADLSAGSVSLRSAAGSVLAQAGSVVDLSGAGRDGDAGSLNIAAAAGTARLQGELRLAPGSGARAAEVAVDAKTLANLGEVASALNVGGAGASLQSIDLRAREGDIVVGPADTLRASRITLAADGGAGAEDGSLRIAGRLEARGSAAGVGNGGRVNAYARNQIEVSGSIDAAARQQGDGVADGGQVLLSARITNDAAAPQGLDAVVLRDGARIDLAGRSTATQRAADGQVTLRARRAGDDVAVAALPANVVQGGKTVVEGVVLQELAGNATLTTLAAQQSQLQAYMGAANRAAMTGRLTAAGASADTLSLRPGLEIRTPGNLTLNAELNFAAKAADGSYLWRYGSGDLATSAPGALTLRAGGNLALNESISDGFASAATTAAVFSAGDSWRYAFTAGSDLAAANARQTMVADIGTLTVGKQNDATAQGAVIRTGTGSISMDAARDVVLQNNSSGVLGARQGQVVYTAGVQVPTTEVAADLFPKPRPVINPVLTRGGGDVDVRAGHDISGGATNDVLGTTQSVSEWLWRGGLGTQASPSVQWVNFSLFQQGLGALGGGNLTLRADGDIQRIGASVASTGFVAGAADAPNVHQYNRGDLDVRAAGAVVQGIYYAEAGQFDLRAARMAGNGDGSYTGTTRLAQGSNVADVQVREQAEVAAPFNPTAYAPATALFNGASTDDYRTTYFTYTPESRFSARVAAGDLTVASVSPAVSNQLQTAANRNVFAPYLAPQVDLVAFGGKLSSNQLLLSPSATGNLHALADGDISSLSVVMSQADPALLPSAAAPLRYGVTADSIDALARRVASPLAGTVALHAADTEPSAVIARAGSISGLQLDLAEAAEVHAAGSLKDVVQIQLQNASAASISRISAGAGIEATGESDSIRIYGPGAAEIVAGGPVRLSTNGNSLGIVSRGNFANPNLPAEGASLIVAAGTGNTADGYARRPDYRNLVTEFVRHDAFASAGAGSTALNADVLALLGKDGNEAGAAELAAVLKAGLADRGAIDRDGSPVQQQLAALSPASLAVGAARLASAIQEVANTRFVQTRNTDTFAAGYAAFNDLFPTLANGSGAMARFVTANPFAASADAAALRSQVITSLRQQGGSASAVADALALGLANPSTLDNPGSAYALAVAALTPEQVQTGTRALLTQTLAVAGADLDKLRAAGRFDAAAGTPYAKALTDFAAAYAAPGLPGLNDIGMASNQIKVEQSGQLSLFAPRGGVLVGQPVEALSAKSADELGLFTLGGGTLTAMARDNVDVYRSRIFTVAGGDIALWSSLQNIDAGKGKTDAAVVPPPRLVLDPKTGVARLDLGGAVTGSGIGALVSQPNQPPSDVTLIAPEGFIDAGEAGIRADRGRVTLGADVVLNTGSIKASSGVAGGKVVVAPPPPVPAATSSGSQANDAVEQTQRNLSAQQNEAEERAKKERRKRVTGEFIGFGDD